MFRVCGLGFGVWSREIWGLRCFDDDFCIFLGVLNVGFAPVIKIYDGDENIEEDKLGDKKNALENTRVRQLINLVYSR